MAALKQLEVTKPFHLTLEEYKKLFKGFRPRGNNVIVAALDPINPVTGIIIHNVSNKDKDQEKHEQVVALASKGVMIVAIGEDVKDLKEGDLVLLTERDSVIYAQKKSIAINDVFPRVRNYVFMIIAEYSIKCFIEKDPTILEHVTMTVNVDKEEESYQNHLDKQQKQKENVNL